MAIDNNIPTFVERDPAVIMAESKAKLEELLGRELQPAQVEQLILNFVVFRETLLVNRFNAGMRQMLYQFSTAPILDYIAGLVAVERLPAASAGCTVRFTLVAGHGSVLIPEEPAYRRRRFGDIPHDRRRHNRPRHYDRRTVRFGRRCGQGGEWLCRRYD